MRTSTVTAIGLAFLLSACSPTVVTEPYGTDDTSSSLPSSPSSVMDDSSSSADVAAPYDGALLSGMHTVVLKTSEGDVTLELNADIAPKTVTNFVTLARSGYYDGLTFHRVIPGFMIQGGDPNGNGTGGRSIFGETFEDEIDQNSDVYKTGYQKGVVAMANRGPDTNGSQFFIMDTDYPLQPDYTIFGKVVSGQDVVHAIATVPRDQGNDMPLTPVTFTVSVEDEQE